MKDFISDNVKKIEISGIRKFFNKVSEYENVISLTLGQPDFEVPYKIKESIIKAINENKTKYTANSGLEELRIEISNYLKSFKINYDKDDICVTIGGSEGIFSAFASIINKGDKILIPSIAYPAYESCIKLLGAQPVYFNLKENFDIDLENLKCAIKTSNPKAIVLSYPSNPTGAILTKKLCDELHKIVKQNNLLVISDEIYSSIYFENDYYSLAQFDDIKDNIILVSGFSKMFSMTGLRVGYVCANQDILKNIVKVHQYNVSCAPSICQYGAISGLKNCMIDVLNMKNEFKKRKDFVYKSLINMGFDVSEPKGAFYIFPSIKKFNIKSEEFCERLLKEYKTAIVPGNAFGYGGEGYIRISYCYSLQELNEALDRLKKFIDNI